MGHHDAYSVTRQTASTPQRPFGEGISQVAGVPSIACEHPGMTVILKPAGWEVDSTGGADDHLLLSSYLQKVYSTDKSIVVHLLGFGYGFLHRLDIPSSGLILVATTFEGLYSLRGQMNTYRVAREYITVCHGLGLPLLEVNARVDATSVRVLRSAVDDSGRPARTYLLTSSHLRPCLFRHISACIVVISIHTGRRHQIRAHTRHIGLPTACDPWYSPDACTACTAACAM